MASRRNICREIFLHIHILFFFVQTFVIILGLGGKLITTTIDVKDPDKFVGVQIMCIGATLGIQGTWFVMDTITWLLQWTEGKETEWRRRQIMNQQPPQTREELGRKLEKGEVNIVELDD